MGIGGTNALKLQNAEIRHSNFLGWLMAPYETHGLGDYFLKEFLKFAVKDFSCDERVKVKLASIALKNFANAEIRREYKNIDILVIDNDSKFLCVVENKTWTGEHDNQLLKYAQIVDREFIGYEKLFIFLTPPSSLEDFNTLLERQDENCKSQKYYYIPMSYEQVFKAIEKTLKFNEKHLNADVKAFIEHYKNMIERNIMGNTDKELVKLCRKIYRENKNAIDMIMKNVSHSQDEISVELNSLIKSDETLVLETSTPKWIRFVPKSIDFSKLNFAKSDWVESNKIIMLEINNCNREQLCVDIIVRCSDDTEKLNKVMQVAKDIFNYSGKTNSYAHILSKPLVHSNEYYDFISNDDITSILKNRLEQSGIIAEFERFANKVLEKF